MECRDHMKRKNILFIMADQMAAPMLPIYGPSPIKLPNPERLAAQGVVFDAAYCNSPLCAPSRFTLVSGQLPSKIGAYDNAADFPADIPTYAHYLRRLGYRTALSGKMHFCGPDQLHGYEERLTSDIYPADYGWAVNWDEPDVRPSWYHNMSSVLQAGPCVRTNQLDFDEEVVFKAQQYLFDHIREDGDQPFCLTVSMTHPHDPYTIPKAFWDLYDDSDIPLPTTPDQHSLDPHSQRLLKVYDLWDKPLPVDKIRDARRAYFGACSYIDANVGKLLQTLEDTGLIDDTIIVFSGDHGDMLGERGLWYKMHWFEMAARVPLLISARGNSRRPGQRRGVHRRPAADLRRTGRRQLEPTAAGRPLAGSAPARAGRARRSVRRIHGRRHHQPADDDPPRRLQIHLQRRRPVPALRCAQRPARTGRTQPVAATSPLFDDFLAEARAKWDIPAIHRRCSPASAAVVLSPMR
jgi:choline-sulfatase